VGLACCLSTAVQGATLSSQSSVGVSAQYDSNPFLQVAGARSAEALALTADLPATYTSDATTLQLSPRLRLAKPYGLVALLSNYEYLDADWRWQSERNVLAASGGWHHDSTYYNQFEQAALFGHDLRRREETANASWEHALNERSDLQLSGLFDEVAYSQHTASSVTDYRYAQGQLQYSRALSERWQWATAVGYGEYRVLDGTYTSDQQFVQTSLNRKLTERWSLSGQVGYANLTAHGVSHECCGIGFAADGSLYLTLIPVRQRSSRGSPNALLTAEWRRDRLALDLSASRAIQPSGFGALVTQDALGLSGSYPWNERLMLTAGGQWSRLSDALGRQSLQDFRYYQGNLNAEWQWTENWALQIQLSYKRQYVSPQLPGAAGATVYLNLLRQFNRIRL
jgi:hypothetical protein